MSYLYKKINLTNINKYLHWKQSRTKDWLVVNTNCDKQPQFCKQLNQCFVTNNLMKKKNIQKTENNFINLKWLPSWQIGANINLIRPFLSTLILVIHGTWEALNILVLISAFSAVNRYKKIKNVHQDIVKAWNFRKKVSMTLEVKNHLTHLLVPVIEYSTDWNGSS